MLDISGLTGDDKDRLRSFLLTLEGVKTLPLHRKKPKKVSQLKLKKPTHWVPVGGYRLTPSRHVKTPNRPSVYYCGACVAAPKRGSGGGRRLRTPEELKAHASSAHPHFPYFGKWPLSTRIKFLGQTLSNDELTALVGELKKEVGNG